jgi:hypothetical protein
MSYILTTKEAIMEWGHKNVCTETISMRSTNPEQSNVGEKFEKNFFTLNPTSESNVESVKGFHGVTKHLVIITHLALMLLAGSAEASTFISDTNTCKINIRKFVSPRNL